MCYGIFLIVMKHVFELIVVIVDWFVMDFDVIVVEMDVVVIVVLF